MPLLEHSLTPAELDLFRSLTTPRKIQDFLDTVRYEPEYFNRAPLRVLRRATAWTARCSPQPRCSASAIRPSSSTCCRSR